MSRVYHRDQSGVPVIPYSTSQGSVAQFAALKVVLKACLVSGYGVLPSAGWALIAEGTNYLVLRNGSESGYVGFTWVAGAGGLLRIYLSKTFTGMSGDVMQGDGLKSGTAAGLTAPQGLSLQLPFHSAANSSWYMIADEKTAILGFGGYSSNQELQGSFSPLVGHTLYFGEDSAGHAIAVGGANSAVSSGNSALFGGLFSAGGFTALTKPLTGLLVDTGAINVHTPNLPVASISTPRQDTIVKAPSVSLAKGGWYGDGAFAGWFRGLAFSPEIHFTGWTSYAAQILGRSTAMLVRDQNAPVDLGDAYTYFLRAGLFSSTPSFLVTDNPEFW
ncbi:hypothetical protein SAMN05216576_10651 [Ectopseudomonas chengduensis]|uniref:Uncharacterized protein n=1 Tax=Ectopseudomonas chengduensis TaxID=489632 RepID=A0A1G6P3A6_9GAMM|nr:hypothetical protein [Pseudomonas chengduensis]MBP3063648.1 hypothetical protein [Pseudomonas chengduensis]NNB73473.1 hypothetical protein [Pseudomonas chengduensis]SDC73905.1 hypothetical protein SAMN05216576_10651 [Pseudomonas chengduensis]